MTLRQLSQDLPAEVAGDADVTAIDVRAVHDDSRKVGPGDVFVAVKGLRSDGHAFVAQAIEQGAAAVVVEREPERRRTRRARAGGDRTVDD